MKCPSDKFVTVYNMVMEGSVSYAEGARLCNYSHGSFWNLCHRYKLHGNKIFSHGLKGRPSNHKGFTQEQITRLLDLRRLDVNNDCSFSEFTHALNVEYEFKISYCSVYKILKKHDISSPYCYRVKKKNEHLPRPPKPHEGQMVQMDATPFRWFQAFGDTALYSLHGAIDDATKKVTGLYVCENECSYGYFKVIEQQTENYGIPLSDYTDQLKFFQRSKAVPTEEEQLRGLDHHQNQWEEMCEQLHITHILAKTSQAKGRIERLWNTIKKILPRRIKLFKLDSVAKLNAYLPIFIKELNERFSIVPKFKAPVWQKPPADMSYWYTYHDSRKTNNAGVISYHGINMQVTQPNKIKQFVKICVSDNGIFTWYKGQFWPVKALDEFYRVSDSANLTLQRIIHDTLFNNLKDESEVVTAG